VLQNAISALQQPAAESDKEQELAKQNEELWAIINEQRALQKETVEKYVEAKESKSGRS
jgi:pre-rRNA-processing protein IPI3